jgi:hypothetical protein
MAGNRRKQVSFLDELIFEENGLVGRNADLDIILFDK